MFESDFFVDLDWLHNIAFRLDGFKRTSPTSHVYACRCPLCGDSQKSKKKKRFYFYTKKGNLNVHCKNCGYSHSFWTFMKEVFPNEYGAYTKDQMKHRLTALNPSSKPFIQKADATYTQSNKDAEKSSTSVLDGVLPLLSLSDSHKAKTYLKSRLFTDDMMSRLLYTDNFKLTCESLTKEPMNEGFPEDGRIIIPFYDKEGDIKALQGRSLSNKGLRYITIKATEESDKIYGLDRLNNKKTSYCVEGPLDSLFIDNCLATCDPNLQRSNADVLIWDNEPRSKEIVHFMESAINAKKKVVIWPTSPDQKEDINDIIMKGFTPEELMYIINERTYSGLKAKLELQKWKRI